VHVTPSAAGPSRDEISRQIRRLFPRLHELKWIETQHDRADESRPTFTPRADFASTVRDYLSNHKELARYPDKDAVLALADEFLRAEGQA
jgi:hypothetical protein